MIALLALGCAPELLEEELGCARHTSGDLASNRSGTERVRLTVEPGDTAFLATFGVAAPARVHVRQLSDPNGDVVFRASDYTSSPYSKTNAAYAAGTVSLGWPIVPSDGPLFPGDWEFELGVYEGGDAAARPVSFDGMTKQDPDFSTGSLAVSIVYTEGLDADPELVAAVDQAVERWAGLYGGVGITLSVVPFAWDSASLGPPASGGEPAYADIADQTTECSVNLVISEQIDGHPEIFGIAGDIPGPALPTARSAVQISSLAAFGPDGEYADDEVTLLAETMAHEVLHYLGLFHPVESSWNAWDVLLDTDQCGDEDECEDSLATNLLFPRPVCNWLDDCIQQVEITPDQAAVAHRYVLVR